jgi:hypothetical protein
LLKALQDEYECRSRKRAPTTDVRVVERDHDVFTMLKDNWIINNNNWISRFR